MSYGGPQVDGKCSVQCDGMPLPSEPCHREFDKYGCAQWIEPEPNGFILPIGGDSAYSVGFVRLAL